MPARLRGWWFDSEACVKKSIIPRSMRDLLSLIMSGDAGSESGMTISIMKFLIERLLRIASMEDAPEYISSSFKHTPAAV